MGKTLLLCFIHGFKGGDDTFGAFPQHLKALISDALPHVAVASVTYPQYETRGELKDCVARFNEWLQNKVIDLSVANGTPSPTVDPSVRTILVGHSMGGIVAADAVLAITADRPISAPAASSTDDHATLMFPYIQGILAFDTPYLGVAPAVVAHGAEDKWNSASAAYSAYNNAVTMFGSDSQAPRNGGVDASRMLPAPAAAPPADNASTAASAASWQRWAMFAGAAGALAAGGAAAYMQRDKITQGMAWLGSHLEFVGCLTRSEELSSRLANVAKLEETHRLGFADLYGQLGAAVEGKSVFAGGQPRTFCTLPEGELERYFHPVVNDEARTETWAHRSMFDREKNMGYEKMCEKVRSLVGAWTDNEWYAEAAMNGTQEDGEVVREDGHEGAGVRQEKEEEGAQSSADGHDVSDVQHEKDEEGVTR